MQPLVLPPFAIGAQPLPHLRAVRDWLTLHDGIFTPELRPRVRRWLASLRLAIDRVELMQAARDVEPLQRPLFAAAADIHVCGKALQAAAFSLASQPGGEAVACELDRCGGALIALALGVDVLERGTRLDSVVAMRAAGVSVLHAGAG